MPQASSRRWAPHPRTKPCLVPRGHIGRIVTGSILGGLLGRGVPGRRSRSPAPRSTSSPARSSLAFAASWATARLPLRAAGPTSPSGGRSSRPSSWASPRRRSSSLAPTGNEAGWVWPPAILALVGWMAIRSRRDLRSRARVLVLYPVFAALVLSAFGGAYETYREASRPTGSAMPGRLVDVGGHTLHISCTGSGSPTVVLEAGLGEPSHDDGRLGRTERRADDAGVRVRPRRARMERVRGRAAGRRAGRDRPAHPAAATPASPDRTCSPGTRPAASTSSTSPSSSRDDVAGVVLLDSMHPEQYERMASWPGFYEMFRRASAVMPSLARLGVGRVVYGTAVRRPARRPAGPGARVPLDAAAQPQRPRRVQPDPHRDEPGRRAADASATSRSPSSPRAADAEDDWFPMQDDLATLSTDSVHRVLPRRHARHGRRGRGHGSPVEPSDPRRRQRRPHQHPGQRQEG